MLPQKHRLSKSADVKKTTARGRSFFNPFFVLKVVPGQEPAKVTLIASVKASKKAVERNRAKRILRDELRNHIENFRPGNYVLIVRKTAVTAKPAELREALVKAITSAKIVETLKAK
jgi:ribonuclease P protein component